MSKNKSNGNIIEIILAELNAVYKSDFQSVDVNRTGLFEPGNIMENSIKYISSLNDISSLKIINAPDNQ